MAADPLDDYIDAVSKALALPIDEGRLMGPTLDFVAKADASVVAAYGVIAMPPGHAASKLPSHLEFLIDRNGFARALWRPDQTIAWDDVRGLLAVQRQLATRPLSAGASPAHAHMQ